MTSKQRGKIVGFELNPHVDPNDGRRLAVIESWGKDPKMKKIDHWRQAIDLVSGYAIRPIVAMDEDLLKQLAKAIELLYTNSFTVTRPPEIVQAPDDVLAFGTSIGLD